jgi:hypothetical protein
VDKDIDPRALHDNWRREAARIAQAARIAISIIAFFDPARAQSMERALNAAVDAHSAIVAFGRGEIASAVFLARIASIGSRISSSQSQTEMRGLSVSFNAALSSFATRLSNLESEVSAIRSIIAEETLVNATRAREIQNELNQISARLARNAQMFSSALQASLRQPFDIQSEKCLGQNSALARLGHFPNNEIARECFDLAQLRASRLAREPAMTHLTTAEDTDFSPLATDPDLLWPWLSRELALAPIAVPNSREWSKGVEDMLLTLLASGLMRESGHLLEPFLRDVESIQELEDAASRPELLEKTWSEAISALKLAQETLHPIWQEFSQNKMFGADPGLFPETIQAMNPQDDLLELGIRAGIASAPERSGVYVVTSDGRTPHSWNPNFPEPIFLRYDWFWDAVVNGEHLGPARAANFLWECDANISACPATEIITPNCDRAAYNRVRGYCTDQAVQRRHLLRRISFDSSVIDKKIAEALKPKLAEALATFPQFASSHRNTRSAKVAVQNAKRALDRFFALLRLSYPSLIEQSQEIQSLWIGEMSIAGEKPFWLALEHPNSMQIFMRSDPNSLKRSIDGALKDAIAKPSFSSAAKKLWALFRDDP